jgi:hypothetical protein
MGTGFYVKYLTKEQFRLMPSWMKMRRIMNTVHYVGRRYLHMRIINMKVILMVKTGYVSIALTSILLLGDENRYKKNSALILGTIAS